MTPVGVPQTSPAVPAAAASVVLPPAALTAWPVNDTSAGTEPGGGKQGRAKVGPDGSIMVNGFKFVPTASHTAGNSQAAVAFVEPVAKRRVLMDLEMKTSRVLQAARAAIPDLSEDGKIVRDGVTYVLDVSFSRKLQAVPQEAPTPAVAAAVSPAAVAVPAPAAVAQVAPVPQEAPKSVPQAAPQATGSQI